MIILTDTEKALLQNPTPSDDKILSKLINREDSSVWFKKKNSQENLHQQK